MKKKLFWAVVALLALAVVVLIAAWPRYLPVIRMHGDQLYLESFEEMVNRAELIVLADIKSVKQGPDFVPPIDESTLHRAPTQRITLEVVKVYRGEVAQGQTVTLYQGGVGVTSLSSELPLPIFVINENDPVYERGERYVLMLGPISMSNELKPFQPEPWQEGMFSVVYPEGRLRLNADGTVTSVLDSFGTNGKTLGEIEERIAAAVAAPSYPAAYQGLTLPTPKPGGDMPLPPPVWLIAGDQASLASLAAGGTERGHFDPALAIPNIATATLPAEASAVIVVAAASFTEFKGTVRPWREDGLIVPLIDETARELRAEHRREGNLIVFTLEPTGDPGDQLLYVNITFPADNAWGFYLWRLNPAPDATPTATSSQSDLARAREALVDYFSLLHARRYAEAVNAYGGSYHLLRDWNPTVDPNDHATLFENGCTINGLMCLEVRTIMQEEVVSPGEFKFVVSFKNEDGSLFVFGPCCGASETDMPPRSQFPYLVIKVDGRFLVQGLPVAVP